MRNVTILLAVTAMLAVSVPAYGTDVNEDFNDTPVGWTYAGDAQDQPASPAGGFGYDDGADAITGTWARNGVTSSYYTSIDSVSDTDAFTFGYDVKVTASDEWSFLQVGVMDTATNNRTGGLVLNVYNWEGQLKLLIWKNDTSGGLGQTTVMEIDADTLYHCEVDYDNGAVEAYVWADGDDKPMSATYTGSGWDGWGSADGFGVFNYDDTEAQTMTAEVDNMTLIPEPATMVLLSIGGIGALIRRRRR